MSLNLDQQEITWILNHCKRKESSIEAIKKFNNKHPYLKHERIVRGVQTKLVTNTPKLLRTEKRYLESELFDRIDQLVNAVIPSYETRIKRAPSEERKKELDNYIKVSENLLEGLSKLLVKIRESL